MTLRTLADECPIGKDFIKCGNTLICPEDWVSKKDLRKLLKDKLDIEQTALKDREETRDLENKAFLEGCEFTLKHLLNILDREE